MNQSPCCPLGKGTGKCYFKQSDSGLRWRQVVPEKVTQDLEGSSRVGAHGCGEGETRVVGLILAPGGPEGGPHLRRSGPISEKNPLPECVLKLPLREMYYRCGSLRISLLSEKPGQI